MRFRCFIPSAAEMVPLRPLLGLLDSGPTSSLCFDGQGAKRACPPVLGRIPELGR